MIAKSMDTQIWHPTAVSEQGGLIKGAMASASTSVWEKAVLTPALALIARSYYASIPAGIYSQRLWRLFFPALEPWAGEPGVGQDSSLLRGHLCIKDIPPDFYPPYMGVGPACSTSPPFLPVSMWLLL